MEGWGCIRQRVVCPQGKDQIAFKGTFDLSNLQSSDGMTATISFVFRVVFLFVNLYAFVLFIFPLKFTFSMFLFSMYFNVFQA